MIPGVRLYKNGDDDGKKKDTYLRNGLNILSTILRKTMICFLSVLFEVIEEPADGFLVIIALLAFNDDLGDNFNHPRTENDVK